jgi:hypothetical protein
MESQAWASRAVGRGGVVCDCLYPEVYDLELLAEIGLTTDLMIAASKSAQHLSRGEVDLALGLGVVRSDPPGRGEEAV